MIEQEKLHKRENPFIGENQDDKGKEQIRILANRELFVIIPIVVIIKFIVRIGFCVYTCIHTYRAIATITVVDRLGVSFTRFHTVNHVTLRISIDSCSEFRAESSIVDATSPISRSGNIFVGTTPEMIASQCYYGTEGADRPITERGDSVLANTCPYTS